MSGENCLQVPSDFFSLADGCGYFSGLKYLCAHVPICMYIWSEGKIDGEREKGKGERHTEADK